MSAPAPNPVALDPKKYLSASEIDVIRQLDHGARVNRVKNGWRVGGAFRKLRTVEPLLRHGIAREEVRRGRHTLLLTAAGRLAADNLRPLPKGPPIAAGRAYWLD